MSNNLLTDDISSLLNGATTATIEHRIDTGTGNLTVDELPEGTQVLNNALGAALGSKNAT